MALQDQCTPDAATPVPNWLFRFDGLQPQTRYLLIIMLGCAEEQNGPITGRAWTTVEVSLEEMAAQLGHGRFTVERLLCQLIRAGLVRRKRQGLGKPNRYEVPCGEQPPVPLPRGWPARPSQAQLKAEFEQIKQAQGYRCALCGRSGLPLERDHKQPRIKGGGEERENIVALCRSCNQHKGEYVCDG